MVAAITLTPATGNVGSTCTVDGTGFAFSEVIDFTFNGNVIQPAGAPISSDGAGVFSCVITIPASTQGAKSVVATDQSAGTDSDNYTVTTNVVITESNITVGGTLNVTGTGFAGTEAITTTLNAVGIIAIGGAFSSDATGGWTKTFTVPAMVNGSKTFDATDVTLNTDSDTVIIDALIVITEATGVYGDTINVVGSGYATVSLMAFTLDAIAIVPVGGAVTSNATGGFTTTFLIPEVPNSTRSLIGTDASANNDTDTIDIVAICIITEANAKYGDTITVIGHGYEATSAITTTLNSVSITAVGGAFSSGATGGWNKTFVIPDVANGSRTFVGADAGAGTDSDTLIIDAYITLDDGSGSIGESVVISGHGFTATSLMAFTFGGSVIIVAEAPLSSGATGAFTGTITVPTGFDDTVSIVATDASTKTDSINFIIITISTSEIVENPTFKFINGVDLRLQSVGTVSGRERGAIIDIPFSADDVYTTGGVLVDFTKVKGFKQVYFCKILHNTVGLVASFVPQATNLASGGKIKFWGTDGNELADNSGAITSKTLTVFIRGI